MLDHLHHGRNALDDATPILADLVQPMAPALRAVTDRMDDDLAWRRQGFTWSRRCWALLTQLGVVSFVRVKIVVAGTRRDIGYVIFVQ
jgi:hypothetical protein